MENINEHDKTKEMMSIIRDGFKKKLMVEDTSEDGDDSIDIEEGSGVDRICDIYDLISVFGEEKFDVVICTETLEHVANWILAISNLKKVLRPGGIMVLSAPRPGRKYHGYPFDFWRYAKEDWRVILSDMIYLSICGIKRGMVVKAIKPLDYEEAKLGMYKLYSVIHQKRRTYVP